MQVQKRRCSCYGSACHGRPWSNVHARVDLQGQQAVITSCGSSLMDAARASTALAAAACGLAASAGCCVSVPSCSWT